MKFLAQLQNPPREFTAIPFWFLNGELTAEELRRQIAELTAENQRLQWRAADDACAGQSICGVIRHALNRGE